MQQILEGIDRADIRADTQRTVHAVTLPLAKLLGDC